MLWLILLFACAPPEESAPDEYWLSPEQAPPLRGGGGPSVSFSEAELGEPCAFLVGGPEDKDRHNLVQPYRGHLVMPWGPEWGEGGLSLFDVSAPCAPVAVGHGYHLNARETHTVGMIHLPDGHAFAGDWAVTNASAGVLIWDLSDASAPVVVSKLDLDGVLAIDSYARLTFSVFWQYPWIFVAAADTGLIVVDARDPRAPVEASRHVFDPPLRAGMVQVVGDIARVQSLKETEHALVDVSDPLHPQPILGGRWVATDRDGVPRSSYAGNSYGDYVLLARKDEGAGPIVYDVSNPAAPAFVSDLWLEGSGGYIFGHEGSLFIGEGDHADIVDLSDPSDPVHVDRLKNSGDMDTLLAYGNLVVLASDDKVEVPGQATALIPIARDPDDRPPLVLSTSPRDGATGVATTTRLGFTFNEMVEPSSVFMGSVRLSTADGEPVPGVGGAQETIGFYSPGQPLLPNTEYVAEILAGGASDLSGNALSEGVTVRFTTGAQ